MTDPLDEPPAQDIRILRVYTVTRDGREWIVCPSCGPIDSAVLRGHGPEHIVQDGSA